MRETRLEAPDGCYSTRTNPSGSYIPIRLSRGATTHAQFSGGKVTKCCGRASARLSISEAFVLVIAWLSRINPAMLHLPANTEGK